MPRSRIEALLNLLDRLQKLAQPFEREEFALQRHQQRIRRRKRIEREQAERRRAIDEADIVIGMAGQRLAQTAGAIFEIDQFDLRAAQIDRRRDNIEAGNRSRHDRLGKCRFTHQHIVAGQFARCEAAIPMPVEALPCGSRSISKVLQPVAAMAVAMLIAVVVLPTPPF